MGLDGRKWGDRLVDAAWVGHVLGSRLEGKECVLARNITVGTEPFVLHLHCSREGTQGREDR